MFYALTSHAVLFVSSFQEILWLRMLRALGITASVVCGHSLGELAALHAGGLLSEQQAIQLAAQRGIAMKTTTAGSARTCPLHQFIQ